MDKKRITLGLLFVIGGFFLMMYNSTQESKARQEQLMRQANENEQALSESSWDQAALPTSDSAFVSTPEDPSAVQERVKASVATVDKPEETQITLENDQLRITLTSYGGAIGEILLKDYPEDNPHTNDNPRPVILNRVSDSPALDLKRASGDQFTPVALFYNLTSQTRRSATFEAVLPSGLILQRSYELSNGEDTTGPRPYIIEHRSTFRNPTAAPISMDSVFLDLGTAAPTAADYMGFNLNASYYDNGDYDNVPISKFSGGGFLFKKQPKEFVEERGIIQWGAVKNQFFATIFTPDTPAEAIVARGKRFPQDPTTGKVPVGITAVMEFDTPIIQPGDQFALSGEYYTGPKSYGRLKQLNMNQDDVMQLGWFLGFFVGIVGAVAKGLLWLMSHIEGLVGNWGIAIIFTTFIIRIGLWPLTAKAARSSKRMQELQKPLAQIKEKYQDNAQKLNEEMMKLWKKHKINPLSGCWPVLIQFPIFIAFFNLLRNSSDLRFAEFLWINDLSMADGTIPLPGEGLPFVGTAINVLPFFWIVSMYFQMKMMPTP